MSGSVLFKLGQFESKPWFIRSSMWSVRKVKPKALERRDENFILPREISKLSELRVASVLDDFSYLSFAPECQLLSLSAERWREEIEAFHPHMLFVESAWMGKEDSWKWKVSVVSPELIELVAWCKERKIPTVFWNKEDPKHFETFIRAAKFFDIVFTTDLDMIPEYRMRLGHSRVYLLPFATQPRLHNPIETYERKMGFCFAGSYYSQQIERNKTFAKFVNIVSRYGELEIFDRYMNTEDVRMSFPERYRRFIVGSLPPENIGRAYKGYMFGINMNSIKNSQTMFARRVFELLSSNTVTVGNYSKGVHNILGDLTVSTDDMEYLKARLDILTKDMEMRDMFRLAGLREVLSHHTYCHRLTTVVKKTFNVELDVAMPEIVVISRPKTLEELERVLDAFKRQTYDRKRLVLVGEKGPGNARDVTRNMDVSVDEIVSNAHGGVYLAFFDPRDLYGDEYLKDLALNAWWSNADGVGKSSCFLRNGAINRPHLEYREVEDLDWRCSIVKAREMKVEEIIKGLEEGGLVLKFKKNISIDRFNYCRDWDGLAPERFMDRPPFDRGAELAKIEEMVDSLNGRPFGFVAKSKKLAIYGFFPEQRNQARHGYLLNRPMCEKRLGRCPDIVKLNRSGQDRFYDVWGVDVCHLSEFSLSDVLMSRQHEEIDLHLFDPALWKCISDGMGGRPTTIFVYGPELPEAGAMDLAVAEGRSEMSSIEIWRRLLMDDRFNVKFASRYLVGQTEKLFGRFWDGKRHGLFSVPIDHELYFRGTLGNDPLKVICVKPYHGAKVNTTLLIDIIEKIRTEPGMENIVVTLLGDWSQEMVHLGPLIDGKKIVQRKEGDDVREKGEVFRKNGIIMMPLIKDMNGSTIREAMACGLVPILNDVGCINEIVDRTCGWVVEPKAEAFVAAIKKLIENEELFHELSKNASNRIKMDQISIKG
ncbi:MAG: glycosyltransferase [Methanomassiliicoccales archaeon]|nr:MAG: glycosyltransferase [Methanomassiliicoccales archaeon]